MKRHRSIQWNRLDGTWAAAGLLGAVFLLGGALGCFLAGNVQGEGGEALREYLETYLSLAADTGVEADVWAVVWEQVRFPLLVLLMGFTAVGLVGIPVLFAVQGFVFAYCVACFCRIFGTAGLIPALFLFGMPALLWAPALFLLGVLGMGSAWTLLRRGFGEERALPFCRGSYWAVCALCAAAILLCVALEYSVLPALVGASARFVL